MQLIDHKLIHLVIGRGIISPVKIIPYYPCLKKSGIGKFLSPDTLPGNRSRKRIEDILLLIKQKPLLGLVWSVKTVSILYILNLKSEHKHGEYISYPVILRIVKPCKRLILMMMKQTQCTGSCIYGIYGEVNAARKYTGPHTIKEAGAYREPRYGIGRFKSVCFYLLSSCVLHFVTSLSTLNFLSSSLCLSRYNITHRQHGFSRLPWPDTASDRRHQYSHQVTGADLPEQLRRTW